MGLLYALMHFGVTTNKPKSFLFRFICYTFYSKSTFCNNFLRLESIVVMTGMLLNNSTDRMLFHLLFNRHNFDTKVTLPGTFGRRHQVTMQGRTKAEYAKGKYFYTTIKQQTKLVGLNEYDQYILLRFLCHFNRLKMLCINA